MSKYVERQLFDSMKHLFDEAMDAEETANQLLIEVYQELKRADRGYLRSKIEKHFRKVGMYIDGKVFT